MNNKKFSFIRYSNCWEDTQILLDALQIQENETGVSVASAGDNTLAMLMNNPAKVYAFDLNKTQLFCLELKMACFKNLPYEETLMFLGVGKCDRLEIYKKIEYSLSVEARKYFSHNTKLIKKGIIHTGKFERFFHIFRNFIIPITSGKKKFSAFADIDDIDRQWAFYQEHINTRRLKFLFHIFFGYKVLGTLGRDKAFYKYVEEKQNSASDIKSRFEFGIRNVPNSSNPYLSYIAKGIYTNSALPLYLRYENYEMIKERIGKIVLVHGDLLSLNIKGIDFANLSDIFEYMDVESFEKNIQFLESVSNTGARIAYWNMQNKQYTKERSFILDKNLSKDLFIKNQSYFYRDFCLYRKGNPHE